MPVNLTGDGFRRVQLPLHTTIEFLHEPCDMFYHIELIDKHISQTEQDRTDL